MAVTFFKMSKDDEGQSNTIHALQARGASVCLQVPLRTSRSQNFAAIAVFARNLADSHESFAAPHRAACRDSGNILPVSGA